MSYIDEIADQIRQELSSESLPEGNLDHLFRLYALLATSLGTRVTQKDVHDAWSVWLLNEERTHAALVPFDQLGNHARERDSPYVLAIRHVAKTLPGDAVSRLLHSDEIETDEKRADQLFEQYKIMVQSSESLVSRRQGINTFFLTANGALITALGLLIKTGGTVALKSVGVIALSVAGLVLSLAWSTLLRSFGQLNTGKFAVIHRLEELLPASIYAAEWEALERGENPKVYRSFTKREAWAPKILCGLYIAAAIASCAVAFGWNP